MNDANVRLSAYADIDPEQALLAVAGARTAVGVSLLALPGIGRLVFGSEFVEGGGRFATRALGTRDLALGLGALMAHHRGRPLRGWIEAGIAVDVIDAATALVAGRGLTWFGRLVFVVGAGALAGAAMSALSRMDAASSEELP